MLKTTVLKLNTSGLGDQFGHLIKANTFPLTTGGDSQNSCQMRHSRSGIPLQQNVLQLVDVLSSDQFAYRNSRIMRMASALVALIPRPYSTAVFKMETEGRYCSLITWVKSLGSILSKSTSSRTLLQTGMSLFSIGRSMSKPP